MRGYFGIGAEGISKPMNVGALFRTANAFGAGFVFTVRKAYASDIGRRADTSGATRQMPFYEFPDVAHLVLPSGCRLVGVELTDDAIELPSFRHPPAAAYVLGPERRSLSPAMLERCDFVVKIPTKFCINVSLAGALVMYDRMLQMGGFPRRPDRPGGPVEMPPEHRHGRPKTRRMDNFLAQPPEAATGALSDQDPYE